MMTGYHGAFVISWTQTELDGLRAAPRRDLSVGATWRWQGEPLRVDGPSNLISLDLGVGEAELRHRAAAMVHKLVGTALDQPSAGKTAGTGTTVPASDPDDPVLHVGFEVTDGHQSYRITIIDGPAQLHPLLLFLGNVPPPETDLWVVRTSLQPSHVNRISDQPTGVICFVDGTRLLTEDGEKRVEELREGDRIQTKDSGVQEIRWIGSRRITGARLQAFPELRPVRIGAGGLGLGQPDGDLLVSPQHRMLITGHRALELFNEREVFVAANDLVGQAGIHVDHERRGFTYYHVLLDNHEVVFANGVETESFHPASAPLESLDPQDRARLIERFPGLDYDPGAYGDHARRMLSPPEAAILMSQPA